MAKLRINELKTSLRGKTYRYFTGWNGTERRYLVKSVRHSQQHKGWYDLIVVNPQGDESKILFSDFGIQQLATYGRHEVVEEIDHCPYRNIHEIT